MDSPDRSVLMRKYPADLAAIRQGKGISLEEIAETTKISVRYLKAIERCEFEQLPGGVFNTSYIRQYAKAIDYSEQELLACYRSVVPEAAETAEGEAKRERRNGVWRLLLPRLRFYLT